MDQQAHEIQHILWSHIQLGNMVRPDSGDKTKAAQKLEAMDELVYRQLPELWKKAAPPHICELAADFHTAYETFKDFVIYQLPAGKNIVGLGGGLSSGKTAFLNTLMGAGELLPEEIPPSAAVPTYLVHGSGTAVKAINLFGACINLEPEAVPAIGHGFRMGKTASAETARTAPLGHILKNLLLETNLQTYENLVFFNTPACSEPEAQKYCARTDPDTVRRQLNMSDSILWFLSVAETEALPDSDLHVLKALNPEIPITVICSKANQRTQAQRARIKANLEEQIMQENLNVDKVFFFDAKTPRGLNSFGIYKLFADWNHQNCDEEAFARRFKRIFSECGAYYRRKLDEAEAETRNLTDALLGLEGARQASACIKQVKAACQQEQALIRQQETELQQLQAAFFKEVQEIAAEAGIPMPEDINRVEDRIANSLQILRYYNKRHKRQAEPEIREELLETFRNIQPIFDCKPGGSSYKGMVLGLLEETAFPGPGEIRFEAGMDYSEFL